MKILIKLATCLLMFFLLSCQTKSNLEERNNTQINNNFNWTNEFAKEHYLKQNDSIYWNGEIVKFDMETEDELNEVKFPIYVGSFPVAPYKTPGNGVKGYNINIGNKNIVMKSVFVRRGPHNEQIFKDSNKKSEVVINILSLTDDPTLSNPTFVSSRNHPNYVAEGTINCKDYKTDWVVIHTADRNSYAVINMRFFDLKFGRTILIAPQKNKSIRFLQIETELLSNENLDAYIGVLKKEKDVIDFFSQESNL
ncbi:hypothetical protein [Yeosuana sp.]|uniref:hypothetical protein n=1 Tax=Yeosuana sp. TaxID=2529388 RepID=UPI004054C317